MEAFVEVAGTGLRFAGYATLPLFLLPIIVLAFPRPAKPISELLVAALDRLAKTAMWIAICAALSIIAIQLVAVILRYVFGLSFSWMTDSIVFAFATIFMLGVAGTLQSDSHVRVDILRREMSPKQRAAIDLAGALLFIVPIGVLILYSGSGQIARAWINLEPFNESDGLPIKYLFISLVPTFSILLMSAGLSVALKSAFLLRGENIAPNGRSDAQSGSI